MSLNLLFPFQSKEWEAFEQLKCLPFCSWQETDLLPGPFRCLACDTWPRLQCGVDNRVLYSTPCRGGLAGLSGWGTWAPLPSLPPPGRVQLWTWSEMATFPKTLQPFATAVLPVKAVTCLGVKSWWKLANLRWLMLGKLISERGQLIWLLVAFFLIQVLKNFA